MHLERSNPEVAFRNCSHCRKYIYDEKTGEPRLIRGEQKERVKGKGPPCETDQCAKGHWSNPTEVKASDMPLLRLYDAVQATGGSCLTEAEKADGFCLYALSVVHSVKSSGERRDLANAVTVGVATSVALRSKPSE